MRISLWRMIRPSACICLSILVIQAQRTADPGPLANAPVRQNADTWSLHGQATLIEQWHDRFRSPYQGPNSFPSQYDQERTFSSTVFIGRKLWPGAELFYNPEILQGHGLGNTVGMAGYPNGEGGKAAFPQPHYNTSRLYIQQTIGLGGETERVDDGQNQLATVQDVNRLRFSMGKFSAADFFDDNAYSHDARTQFMNWALIDSAAWDYPADALGYTGGFVAELNTKRWILHYGVCMEPTEANGPSLDWHLTRAWGQILQFDAREIWNGHPGTLRPFLYWNHAKMGDYRDALADPVGSLDVTRTRAYRSKIGVGLSWDQELSPDLGVFARLSWNDGRTETWAFTEIDRSAAGGLSLKGSSWERPSDILGLAVTANALSSEHRAYLAAGGIGMILGDGALAYSPEAIFEGYYDLQLARWLWLTPDYQYVIHPGYNSARGPVAIYGVRAHVEY